MHAAVPAGQPTAAAAAEAMGPDAFARRAAEREAARQAILAAGAQAAAEATAQLPGPVVDMLEEHTKFLHGTGARTFSCIP